MAQPKLIVVTGPECSGKSTLSKTLSETLGEPWVTEYAVEYLQNLNRPYRSEDLVNIAIEQLKSIEEARARANKLIIADTGIEVIEVWHRDKLGPLPPELLELRKNWQPDFYLLCKPDIPYEPHPLREDEHRRDELFGIYQQMLVGLGHAVIEGEESVRIRLAVEAIRNMLKN